MRPQIRFKEFTDEWEEKKFLDSFSLLMDYRGKTPKKLGLDWGNGNIKALSALNVKKGYIDWSADVHIGSEELYNAWMKKGSLKKDDILFTTEAPLGNIALVPDNKKYILSQRVIALRTNKNCNSRFIFQSMSNFFFQNQIQKRSTGTTAKGINQKGLSKIKIQLPSLPEQEKIGKFFSLLDQRIEKQERKVALLKEEKKGYMQKLFKQGLRFKDEQGNDYPDWEEKKLKEVSTSKGGTALEKYVNDDGRYYFVSIGNYGINGKYIDNGQRIDLTDKTKERLLEKNDLVMILNDKTSSGEILGTCILIPENNKYIYNQRSQRIILNNDIFPLYAYYYLNYPFRKKVVRQAQGGTQIYVNYSSVENIFLKIPSLLEQEKIAKFLSLLDQRIEKEQEKLKLMKKEKQGFMQRMFV